MSESRYILTMFVVTKNPSDYPGQYVIREMEAWPGRVVAKERPEMVVPVGDDSLLRINNHMKNLGLVKCAPSPKDDPVIVEVWL